MFLSSFDATIPINDTDFRSSQDFLSPKLPTQSRLKKVLKRLLINISMGF